MPTQWFYPSIITQIAEVDNHIPWDDSGFLNIRTVDKSCLTTVRELLHIANPTTHDIKMKTYFLYTSGYNCANLPESISGIEVETSVMRGGRITDETIQLVYDGEFIGDNRATFTLDVEKTYGSNIDLWGTSATKVMLEDSKFGVGIRFQSHPSWPHRESPRINYVRLRAW